jgi:hypothetical protein
MAQAAENIEKDDFMAGFSRDGDEKVAQVKEQQPDQTEDDGFKKVEPPPAEDKKEPESPAAEEAAPEEGKEQEGEGEGEKPRFDANELMARINKRGRELIQQQTPAQPAPPAPEPQPATQKEPEKEVKAEDIDLFQFLPAEDKEKLEEYPEIFGVAQKLAKLAADKQTEKLRLETEEVKRLLNILGAAVAGQMVEKQNTDLDQTRQKFLSSVTEAHADFIDIIKSKEFAEWKEGQSENVRAMCTSWVPEDAIDIVNLFKNDIAIGKAKVIDAENKTKKDKVMKTLRQVSGGSTTGKSDKARTGRSFDDGFYKKDK